MRESPVSGSTLTSELLTSRLRRVVLIVYDVITLIFRTFFNEIKALALLNCSKMSYDYFIEWTEEIECEHDRANIHHSTEIRQETRQYKMGPLSVQDHDLICAPRLRKYVVGLNEI
jgi:hypothetical protein